MGISSRDADYSVFARRALADRADDSFVAILRLYYYYHPHTSMNTSKVLLVAVVAALVLAGVWFGTRRATPPPVTVPPVVEATYVNASADLVVVSSPLPGAAVPATVTVTGQARGTWYFEASFPLEVVAASGEQLVQMPVQAQGEWMTTNFVPFSAQVTLLGTYKGAAKIILHNDNPSGLPENEKSLTIPIVIQ